MDYERIGKRQVTSGGGLSPGKLRSMIVGVDRKKKEDMRSGLDDCKDVDVVSEMVDSSTSGDYDIKSVFEFQKDKAPHRLPIRSFSKSKPPPSKWDDAQKWIANPPKTKKGPIKILEEADTKQILMLESATEVNLSRHDSSIATAFAQPPSTARSVSMRDMGTEMTPIASQEPSRNGTPIRATTPISSAPPSPGRQLSEKELQIKTRREIMVLGTQLGKLNIAAWASKEGDDKDASPSPKTSKSVSEARASAWEEAEKAKHMARFRREEMKIQAWENHQKAKSEADMKNTEVEVERIKGRAQEQWMKKLAAIERKAEGKRAAAEAKKNRQAARTDKQAEQIRRTGEIPSVLFSCFSFCS